MLPLNAATQDGNEDAMAACWSNFHGKRLIFHVFFCFLIVTMFAFVLVSCLLPNDGNNEQDDEAVPPSTPPSSREDESLPGAPKRPQRHVTRRNNVHPARLDFAS